MYMYNTIGAIGLSIIGLSITTGNKHLGGSNAADMDHVVYHQATHIFLHQELHIFLHLESELMLRVISKPADDGTPMRLMQRGNVDGSDEEDDDSPSCTPGAPSLPPLPADTGSDGDGTSLSRFLFSSFLSKFLA